MSFRNRLTLFFVMIVIVPMVSVAVVVFRLISDNQTSKLDAQVGQAQTTAVGLYKDASEQAGIQARAVARDPVMSRALAGGSSAAASARASTLLDRLGVKRIVVLRGGTKVVDVGATSAVAPARRGLIGPGGSRVGELDVSTQTADEFVARVKRITGLDAVVRLHGKDAATTLPAAVTARLPSHGDVTIHGREFRAATFQAPGVGGERLGVSLMLPTDAITNSGASRNLAALALVAFLILAFGLAVTVSRALEAEIGRLVEGARRLAGGDFSTPVPADGGDEFAKLGREFNTMAEQLDEKIEQLRRQRAELEESIRSIGAAAAANLDRDALLTIVLGSAVAAVQGDAGRAVARDGVAEPLLQRAVLGDVGVFADAIRVAEEAALGSGRPGEADDGDMVALAHPLGSASRAPAGVITVARAGEPFSPQERDLIHYLAAQATVSLENVDLHDVVQRQAVTDELTGLFNHRRFQEVVDGEVERARRFETPLGVVMLDIDNFKRVNDTYGHQQGDLVLREVSRVLKEQSREIDEPARYGGEELAVALPQTDLEGAANFAERVRAAIEALGVRRLDGSSELLRVTASLGVAALPHSAGGKDDLVAAADAALYRAKAAGKNRVERADAPAPTARAK